MKQNDNDTIFASSSQLKSVIKIIRITGTKATNLPKILNFKKPKPKVFSLRKLVYKKKVLETCTSNLLFIRNNEYYSPKNNCYIGNTINYLSKKVKINFKDINLKDIHKFDEILLIGSGKGVTPVKFIKQYKWKNRSMSGFKRIKKNFKLLI